MVKGACKIYPRVLAAFIKRLHLPEEESNEISRTLPTHASPRSSIWVNEADEVTTPLPCLVFVVLSLGHDVRR
jgi:hypothetical protein